MANERSVEYLLSAPSRNMEKIANREQNVKAESDQSANDVLHKARSNTEQLRQRQRLIQSKGKHSM